MNKENANAQIEELPSLVEGGMLYFLLEKLRIAKDGTTHRGKYMLFTFVFTCLPIIVLTLIEGDFFLGSVDIPFIRDLSAIVRYFIAIPIFVFIEPFVDKVFTTFIYRTKRIIKPEDENRFDNFLDQLDRMTTSIIPELVIVAGVVLFFSSQVTSADLGLSTWSISADAEKLTWAGRYYIFISMPIYQFLFARWIWRYFIWVYSIYRISRFDLKIFVSHADAMGGLEFVGVVPFAFSITMFALSTIVAGMIGEGVVFQGNSLFKYVPIILVYAVGVVTMLIAPLSMFVVKLMKAKAKGINLYGALLVDHHQDFEKKWFRKNQEETILGNMDASSLADINGGYESVSGMQIFPMTKQKTLALLVIVLVPFLPLYFTVHSITDIMNKLSTFVFG